MIFHKHSSGAPLCNYIDCMVYVEGNNKGVGFPKTAMSLVFNLNDSFRLFADNQFSRFMDYRKYWVAGFQTQPSYVESYGESKMLVIQFKTLGAYVFLNQPLHHFTNAYVHLDDVFSKEAERVWIQMKETGTIQEKFLLAEKFLLRQFMIREMPGEKLLTSIVQQFSLRAGRSVEDICRWHNISRKHLNFLFQEYLGVSPKTLSSLNRFQHILQTIGRSKPEKLSDIAYELDFFDQAHFSNNFKKFTGIRPNDYIRELELQPTLKLIPHFLPMA